MHDFLPKIGPHTIVLFGSQAMGDARPDLDLLIIEDSRPAGTNVLLAYLRHWLAFSSQRYGGVDSRGSAGMGGSAPCLYHDRSEEGEVLYARSARSQCQRNLLRKAERALHTVQRESGMKPSTFCIHASAMTDKTLNLNGFQYVIDHSEREEIQPRWADRRWAKISEANDKNVSGSSMEDRETVHDAFFDRTFSEGGRQSGTR